MALIKCVECSKEISDKASSCPNCGAPIASQINDIKEPKAKTSTQPRLNSQWQKSKTFKVLLVAIPIVVIVAIAIALYSDIHSKNLAVQAAEAQAKAAQGDSAAQANAAQAAQEDKAAQDNAAKAAQEAKAAQDSAAHAPLPPPTLTLLSGIENVQAHSWRALPFTLPHSGKLTVGLSVVNGNEINVEVINREELVVFENNKHCGVYSNFSAPETKTYLRSSRMEAGNYYLLLRDKTLGIRSKKASDVMVRAILTS